LKSDKYDLVRLSNQPVSAIIDSKFNRNMIAGGPEYKAKIFVVNDQRENIGRLKTELFLRTPGGKENIATLGNIETGPLAPAGMESKILTFKVPKSVPTGHYFVWMKITAKGVNAENFFARELYILNSEDIKIHHLDKLSGIRVFAPSVNDGVKYLEALLKRFKIPFSRISSLDKLEACALLIIPPMTIAKDFNLSTDFRAWLTSGGKLICFEQENLLPVLTGRIIPTSEHGFSAELLEPEHLLFKGLIQSDFIIWNSNDQEHFTSRNLFHYTLVPTNLGALAVDLVSPSKFGMPVGEYKFDKGKVLLTQFEALHRFDRDSVATKYLVNLFDYTLGDWDCNLAFTAKLPKKTKKLADFKTNLKKLFFIDLKPFANMGFTDKVGRDGKGGWTDNGPDKDMRNLPVGRQILRGVPFNIIDPAKNHNKSCVVLRGSKVSRTDFLPNEVKNIRLDKRVKKLYFLVAADWTPSQGKQGEISVAYSNVGMGMFFSQDIPLIAGKNIANWKVDFDTPDPQFSVPGWVGETGRTASYKKSARTYIIEWENPDPQRPLLYFSVRSLEKAAIIILAVTGEEE
jgi:beta-galactosidase